jgi:hypothetical protein
MLEEGSMNVTALHSWVGEDGGVAYVEESASPVMDAEGAIDTVVLVARHLTEHGVA